MSKKGNSVFSAVVPVLGASQTTAPISIGANNIVAYRQGANDADPTIRYSTGSTLLDSFVQEAEYSAFALQTELTSLSLELKRIADPRIRPRNRADIEQKDAAPSDDAVQAKREGIARAKQQAQRQALKAIQQAKQLASEQAQSSLGTKAQKTETQKAETQQAKPHSGAAVQNKKSQARRQSPIPVQAPLPSRTAPVLPENLSTPSAQSHSAQAHSAQASAVKVYGGADYKAMQARAQAGGLINLEDDLLFGGTEKATVGKKRKATATASEPDFLSGFIQPLEDFTRSPVAGGWHPTAHLDDSPQSVDKWPTDEWPTTVLDIDSFKLSGLEPDELDTELGGSVLGEAVDSHTDNLSHGNDAHSENSSSQTSSHTTEDGDELTDLDALGRQVTYLNQRIEFLSKKLAAITNVEPDQSTNSRKGAPAQRQRYSVTLGLDTFQLSNEESSEKRVATLEPLVSTL